MRGGEESKISLEDSRGCGLDAFFEPFGLPPFFPIDAEATDADAKEAGGEGDEELEEDKREAEACEREIQIKKSHGQV